MPTVKKTSKKGSKKCSKGYIYREPYVTKRKSKTIKVKGSCIKATSQSGKKTSIDVKKHFASRERMYKQARQKYGNIKCKKGSIVREGYKKKSGVWVKPTCIKDTGKPGKQARTIYIEKDRLKKYGYSDVVNMSQVSRHRALKRALGEGEKPLSVMRRLVALSTLSKNTNPRVSDVFSADAEWIKTTDEYMNRNVGAIVI